MSITTLVGGLPKTVIITSYKGDPADNREEIPELEIVWGCLAENSMITMSDGEQGYYDGRIASAVYEFDWEGAPNDYDYQYYYDVFGRLIKAENSEHASGNFGVETPANYDANGNILGYSDAGNDVVFSYESGTNKVTKAGDASYQYDANGNIETVSSYAQTQITYDQFNQLARSVTYRGIQTDLHYGVRDQRVLKSTGGHQRSYFHALEDYPLVERVLAQGTDGAETRFIYGPLGAVAAESNGDIFYLIKDHIGSTRVILDGDALVRAWFNYQPFGSLIHTASFAGTEGIPNHYRFTGQEYDSEYGLHNYRARIYDDRLLRFLQPDPLAQYPSPYEYGWNNPLSNTDPTGTWFGWDDAIALAVGALVGGVIEGAKYALAHEGEWNWSDFGKQVAKGAVIGAIVGETALYTGGGSLMAAATTVGTGMAIGATINAGMTAASYAITTVTCPAHPTPPVCVKQKINIMRTSCFPRARQGRIHPAQARGSR